VLIVAYIVSEATVAPGRALLPGAVVLLGMTWHWSPADEASARIAVLLGEV